MQKVVSSKQFSLKLRDFVKGALMAVIIPVLVVVQESLEQGQFDFDWSLIAKIAIGAFVGYLSKNFLDKPKVIITTVTNQNADQKVKEIEQEINK